MARVASDLIKLTAALSGATFSAAASDAARSRLVTVLSGTPPAAHSSATCDTVCAQRHMPATRAAKLHHDNSCQETLRQDTN